jgi:formyltetrahydrofolate deformylase
MKDEASAILLINCPDQHGLVAKVTAFLSRHNGNIIHLEQHVDFERNMFFMRIEWELAGFDVAREAIADEIKILAEPLQMTWSLYFSDIAPRMAVFVSKQPHCLFDIISRVQANEWAVELPLIISNHPDAGVIAERFDIPFEHLPITKENKQEQEQRQVELLRANNIDFIVLARYMQVISPELLQHYPNRIINIHHSFLPAFAGARPYHSAYERGVKLIGTTSHYITEELDAGPIIEQDIIRVSHKDSVRDLIRKGRDLEKVVLARAIYAHLQRKILVYDNKTVIFT